MVLNLEEPDKFYGKIIIIGDSLGITIPTNIVKGNAFDVGDKLIVWIKKNLEEKKGDER